MEKVTCKEAILKEFKRDSKMKTANTLKLRLNKWTLNTIKGNLSKLKKENILIIGFRTRGRNTRERGLNGEFTYVKGNCYYMLK